MTDRKILVDFAMVNGNGERSVSLEEFLKISNDIDKIKKLLPEDQMNANLRISLIGNWYQNVNNVLGYKIYCCGSNEPHERYSTKEFHFYRSNLEKITK